MIIECLAEVDHDRLLGMRIVLTHDLSDENSAVYPDKACQLMLAIQSSSPVPSESQLCVKVSLLFGEMECLA